DAPTSGAVTVNGRRYADCLAPLAEVGVLLEARAVHGGRSAYAHLLALAQTNGIPRSRVDALIDLVGLRDVARRRAGNFSLGMGQRLGIAAALLGDPEVVVLDEPVNGLDPEGIRWIRDLLRDLAAEGRTVLVSSHLMSEMAVTADHLVVVGQGRLIADTSVADFVDRASSNFVVVRTPEPDRLRAAVAGPDVAVTPVGDDALEVRGLSSEQIGRLAFTEQIPLYELSSQQASLEEAFMELTRDAVDFRGGSGATGAAARRAAAGDSA
ncbi:MAG TPA: AAA family ATPase, partial [Mycobacteriales bacterium]